MSPPLSELPPKPEEDRGELGPLIKKPPPGPRCREAALRLREVESPAFGARSGDEANIVLTTGRGANVYDLDGNRYVDLAAGFGSVLLGHLATPTARAMAAQSDRLIQGLGDVLSTDAKLALLERLVKLHPGEHPKVILGQSGSDAVSAAIKTATLATGRPGIVAFEGAYHGLGYGPLAACGLRSSYRTPFAAQLNPHVTFVPYPGKAEDVDAALSALTAALSSGEVGTVLVEPVLGRGGCVVPPTGFVRAVVDLAHERGALVVADEIWTGLGRCGAMVRSVTDGATADILCFGKGLGGGAAISACIAPEPIMRAWAREEEVVHTSTHVGAPLPCAMAIATLDALRFKKLPDRASEVGSKARAALKRKLHGLAGVREVRGDGLMLGVALDGPERTDRVLRRWLAKGYLALAGGGRRDVITLTPPLTITEGQLEGAVDSLCETLAEEAP